MWLKKQLKEYFPGISLMTINTKPIMIWDLKVLTSYYSITFKLNNKFYNIYKCWNFYLISTIGLHAFRVSLNQRYKIFQFLSENARN